MKILFLTPRLPFPPKSGGQIKTFKTIKLLAKKYKVFLVCFCSNSKKTTAKKPLEKICQRVEVIVSPYPTAEFKDIKTFIFRSLFSPLPFIVFRHYHREMKDLVERLIKKEKFEALHIDHLAMASYLPKKKEGLWFLEEHNIESEINWGIFKKESWNKFKIFSFLEALKAILYEKRIIPKFDYIFAISKEDKKKLVRLGAKKEKVFFLPTPFEIRNLFSSQKRTSLILFVGGLAWWPNKDGLLWFYEKIYPLVKKEIPKVKSVIIGAHPPKEIARIGEEDSSVQVKGYLPEIKPFLSQAGVFIVPIRAGSGVRIKILDALSFGLPVVSTKKGAEGIANKNEGGLILADEPEKFAKAIVEILKNKKLAEELSKAGLEFIKNRYNEEKTRLVLEKVYQRVNH